MKEENEEKIEKKSPYQNRKKNLAERSLKMKLKKVFGQGLLFALVLLGGFLLGRGDFSARESPPEPTPIVFSSQNAVAVVAKVGPAVVGVTSIKGKDFLAPRAVTSGSGVVFDRNQGYLVTSYHVVEGAQKLIVSLDEKHQAEAKLVGGDPETDLAVLKINPVNLPEARFGDSDRLQVGESVVAIGNPLGRAFARSVTAGVVSALNRIVTLKSGKGEINLRVLQTDAAINPGNSGGPLVNMQGEVVGINSVKIAAPGVEGIGFAVPINDVKPILTRLINTGKIVRPSLGLQDLREITPEVAPYFGFSPGLYVGKVAPGSPAARAGLKPGDIITRVQEREIRSLDTFQEIVNHGHPGDKLELELTRGSQKLKLNLET